MKTLSTLVLTSTLALSCAKPREATLRSRVILAQVIHPRSIQPSTPDYCIYAARAFVTPNPADSTIPLHHRLNTILTSDFDNQGRLTNIGTRCIQTSQDAHMTACLQVLRSIDTTTSIEETPFAVCSYVEQNDGPANLQVGISGRQAELIHGLITVFGMSERIQFTTVNHGVYKDYDCNPRFLANVGIQYTSQQIEVINGNEQYVFDQTPEQHQFGNVLLLPFREINTIDYCLSPIPLRKR